MSPVTLFSRDAPAPDYAEPMSTPINMFAAAPEVKLHRTGQRPYVFEGVEVCSATTHSPGPSLWYEVNLYRKQSSSLVIDGRFFGKPDDMKDHCRTYFADSLDEVAHVLESYDPAMDIDADVPVNDMNVPISTIALHAAMIRMRLDEARRQFADLTGEMLYQLDVH